MARADLKKRLDGVAAALGSPVIMGEWAHQDGRPTYHHLAAKGTSLEAWFRTGKLPDRVQFFAVLHVDESERLYVPDREQFRVTNEEITAYWQPFPELHPDTVKQFGRMLELPFYSFVGGTFLGMNGPLPPDEQRTELYPHG